MVRSTNSRASLPAAVNAYRPGIWNSRATSTERNKCNNATQRERAAEHGFHRRWPVGRLGMRHSANGRIISVADRRLSIDCDGEPGSATVVLIAGGGGIGQIGAKVYAV